ncbi:hypothetical protein C1H46_004378 [Malus baccata]|uniref:Uncharacterized protein n=1 Tax=Malus baccata TaxID=106549 RepID=A0A540NG15_MALBA|nr:hypothetical protein C1H46_004378 [Malus baccata]
MGVKYFRYYRRISEGKGDDLRREGVLLLKKTKPRSFSSSSQKTKPRPFSYPLITDLLRFAPSRQWNQGNGAQTIRGIQKLNHSRFLIP